MSDYDDLRKAFYLAQQKGDTAHARKFAEELAAQGKDYNGQEVDESTLQSGDTLGGNVWNGKGWVSPDKYDLPLKPVPIEPPAAQKPKNASWGTTALRAAVNLPGSTLGVAGDVVSSILHPIDTTQGVLDLGNAALQKVLPDSINQMMPESTRNNPAKLNAVVDFYKSRYGNMENFKEALASDPASILADASTLLTGGGSLVSKLPVVGKAGAAVANAGRFIDPLRAGAALVPSAGRGIANIIGGAGTHTGGESLKVATRAGATGGKMAKNFIDNMRGNVPMTDVLEMGKQNITDMAAAKSKAYQQGLLDMGNDQTILDFSKIDDSLANSLDAVTYKGVAKNPAAHKSFNAISDEINIWKGLAPSEYHTPMGFDALKQRVGAIGESIPYEEKTARMVSKNIYNAIKDDITRQAPEYSKVMRDYSESSSLINELEKSLGLKTTTSDDTAMRKLQSILRNNVNTNFSNRGELLNKLETKGRNELRSSLAGQTLNSWMPRGLANVGLTGIGSYAVGGVPLAALILMLQSPRLMGEVAHGIGVLAKPVVGAANKTKKLLDSIHADPTLTGNLLYQSRETR